LFVSICIVYILLFILYVNKTKGALSHSFRLTRKCLLLAAGVAAAAQAGQDENEPYEVATVASATRVTAATASAAAVV